MNAQLEENNIYKAGSGKTTLLLLSIFNLVQLCKKESVCKIQGKVTKFIKSWLNLPKCCTLSSIFHPEVLNLPFLPHYQESATMLELTIPSNSKEAITKAKERKTNKPNYNSLIGDLEERRLSVAYRTLEIGSLGHYLSDAALCISHSFKLTNQKLNRFSRKPPKQLLPAHIIFLTQGTLPAGTQTNPFIVRKSYFLIYLFSTCFTFCCLAKSSTLWS